MIYNLLENYVLPEEGKQLIRTIDGHIFKGRIYLTYVRELFNRPLDKPYKLKKSDFTEVDFTL